ncbi:MAG TPA: hypothetical protein VGK73_30890 [Polyangiaceae bacterium]
MARVARSPDDIPPPPKSGPDWSTLGWALFALLVVALLVVGFWQSRAPGLP